MMHGGNLKLIPNESYNQWWHSMREHEHNTWVKNQWCHAIIVAIVTTHEQDNPGFESFWGN